MLRSHKGRGIGTGIALDSRGQQRWLGRLDDDQRNRSERRHPARGNYVALDRDVAPTPEEKDQIMHDILSADYFLTSANAIAEDGTMVNIDGVSNRLAAMCYGPRHVLYIIGMNKAVSSPEDAYQRARTEAAPINAMRFDLNTPCRNTGCCYDCQSPDTICCQILITRHSRIPGRAKVILVEESLGF